MLADVGADRLQQVGLAEPGAAVDEERVVCLCRRLGDRERGGVREPVRRPDDEVVERVLRVRAVAAAGLGLRALARATGSSSRTGGSSWRTVSVTRSSRPAMSQAAARIRPRNLPSIHSRVKSFGTSTEKASSVSSPGPGLGEPGRVGRLVEGLAQARRRALPTGSRQSARLGAPRLSEAPSVVRGRPSIATLPERVPTVRNAASRPRKQLFCRVFTRHHSTLHSCG